jgi:hypothetical protein
LSTAASTLLRTRPSPSGEIQGPIAAAAVPGAKMLPVLAPVCSSPSWVLTAAQNPSAKKLLALPIHLIVESKNRDIRLSSALQSADARQQDRNRIAQNLCVTIEQWLRNLIEINARHPDPGGGLCKLCQQIVSVGLAGREEPAIIYAQKIIRIRNKLAHEAPNLTELEFGDVHSAFLLVAQFVSVTDFTYPISDKISHVVLFVS